MSSLKNDFQVFLYKKKLNEKTLMDILDLISPESMKLLLKDLDINTTTDIIHVFSDGNCLRNGQKNAKGGYSVYFTNDLYKKFNKTRLLSTIEPTNNKAELSGIKCILKTINDNKELFTNKNVMIYTDSEYSIKCLTLWYKSWIKNNWENKKGELIKNKDLIESIINLINENHKCKIEFKHVFGHTIEPKDKSSIEYFYWNGNNIVDTNINELFNISLKMNFKKL